MSLGNCRHCEAQLGVLTGYREDGEGFLLDAQGRRVGRKESADPPTGRPARVSRVACTACGLPHPDHPYQAQLDAAARQVERTPPPPPPTPQRYSLPNELELLSRRQDALEAENRSLRQELAELREPRRPAAAARK